MARVWDSVLVNDELDLLELRLRLLEDVVDRFVVVEAARTFTGRPKPLHVAGNRDRFRRWKDRLELVTAELSDRADSAMPLGASAVERRRHLAFSREREQERAQLRVLAEAAPDDLVILADVDELVHPGVVRWLLAHRSDPIRLRLRQAMYRANWEWPACWSDGPYAFRARDLDTDVMAQVMTGRPLAWHAGHREDELDGCGWHFTSLGTFADVKRKLGAYSHVEHDIETVSGLERLAHATAMRAHFLGRSHLVTLERGELDDLQSALLALRPDLFDFSPGPSVRGSKAASAAFALSQHKRLAAPLDPYVRGRRFPSAVAAGLAVVEQVRIARRRRTPDPWSDRRRALLRWDHGDGADDVARTAVTP
jgi:beta-1,4-mannosyl-glycoprotein beta-1,4-N-acetylglucosaminyltransferase